MGFPESEVRAALNAARGNGDVAVEFLMNPAAMIQATQMQAAQQQAAAAPAATGAGGSGVTLESLRQHPQFAQLRRVVQANPASVNSVLELIGQQSPDLLAAIHEDQQAFMDMMLSDDEPAAPAASGNAAAANAANAASAGPMGGGMGGAPNMMQIMGMISSLPPEQQAGMLQQMGLTPAQFQAVQEQLASMPPEQLEQLMTQAHGAAGGAPSPDQGQVIQLTSAEMAHVNQLSELGFTQQQAAEAYLVCDKDMDAAAAYLFSQGDS